MIIHVAMPIPVRKTFSYAVPQRWVPFIEPLVRVRAPFKNKDLVGFIVGVEEGDAKDFKEIYEVIDPFPLLDENSLRLTKWASHYYIAPEGLALKYALPPGLPLERYLKIHMIQDRGINGLHGITLKKACSKVGRDVVYDYYKRGFLRLFDAFTNQDFTKYNHKSFHDVAEKNLFIGGIDDRIRCYTEVIGRHLDRGENVLMLVPDHHSVGQFFLDKLSKRFSGRILQYGVSVNAKKRMETYFRARNEGGVLVLGSRSCLFLPVFQNGHIIVERPEEDEYRNEEGFRFNAVNLAIRRAEIEGTPILLGSVSPPLEIFKRVVDGEFHVTEKVHPKPENFHEIITEKGISVSGGLPKELTALIARAMEGNEIVVIYTPRKDYSSHIKCLDCKNLFRCPLCGGGLSYQKHKDSLVCADCGRTFSYQDRCRECGSKLIQFSNVGVEYLDQKLREALPGVPILQVTGETLRENRIEFKGFCPGEPAVIIGTQALSKPYGLKAHKLIMIEWEELMRVGGYRAGEKMFHVLSNLIDALSPKELHVFMARKKRVNLKEFFDVKDFCIAELEKRRNAQFPPYVRIFLLEIEKENEPAGRRLVGRINSIAGRYGIGQHITGPLMQRRKGYRWRMILKGTEGQLYEPLSAMNDLPGVRIEADPVNI